MGRRSLVSGITEDPLLPHRVETLDQATAADIAMAFAMIPSTETDGMMVEQNMDPAPRPKAVGCRPSIPE